MQRKIKSITGFHELARVNPTEANLKASRYAKKVKYYIYALYFSLPAVACAAILMK